MKDGKGRSLSLSFLRGMKLQFLCSSECVYVNFEEEVFTFMNGKFTHICENKNEIHL